MNRTRLLAEILMMLSVVGGAACDGGAPFQAKQIESQDELIGGPSQRGKLGDYLIENDQVRAIVGGASPGFAAGVFGGTLLDVDRQRWQSEYRYGKGFDAFSEAFPLANLLVANPSDPTKVVRLTKDDVSQADTTVASIVIPEGKDGRDGKEAIIRVQGHSAYMFDTIKYLNRPFLESMLQGLSFSGYDFTDILSIIPGFIGTDLYSLLDRLQISFDFTTDYILHPGDQYVTMRTTVVLAPQGASLLNGCPPVQCDKTCETAGFVTREVTEDREWTPPGATDSKAYTYKRMCPICECAGAVANAPTFNESRDFFTVLLGTPDEWKDPTWKGGVLLGDFLFYGGNTAVFGPGLGYDVDRKVFEDQWQGVGTIGSPFALDWVGGTAENVSYNWTTVNPNERHEYDCPSYRLLVTGVDPTKEADLVQKLFDAYAISKSDGAARVRQAIVDHRPIVLPIPEIPIPAPEGRPDFATWAASVVTGPAAVDIRGKLGDDVTVSLAPLHACMPSKVLVPIYSSSATGVFTHFTEGDKLTPTDDGSYEDRTRSFTFELYLVVGDGDIGSTLHAVYQLRNAPYGEVKGFVIEEGSQRPISHANVFVLQDVRDPLASPPQPAPATYQDYEAVVQKATGTFGFVSQMQTDLGLDPLPDGDFTGPLPPGRYFLVAHTKDRGSSGLLPITIETGATVNVLMTLPAPGSIDYRIQDDSGNAIPAKIALIPLDDKGLRYDWEGINAPEMGDPRYDHGILKYEMSLFGSGSVAVPPGTYDVQVSRGIEYGIKVVHDVTVKAGQHKPLTALLPHEIDTTGWISGDFHVHASPSTDSGLPLDQRLKAAVTEGLEFFSSSDHDVVTNYLPLVMGFGVQQFIQTQVGTETSPLEYGHYNGYPMSWDARNLPVHDPAPWPGQTLTEVWAQMRDRRDAPADAFVLQVNHPRDGVMGYFNEVGMRAYDLERKVPGMQKCDAVLEEAPCDFNAMELMNSKNFEYLHTPTVGEVHQHNACYQEIVAAQDPAKFVFDGAADVTGVVCGWLQQDPTTDCAGAASAAAESGLSEDELARRTLVRDHCAWHSQYRSDVAAKCAGAGAGLVSCKRGALEGLKALMVRYMMERTPEEHDAYFATTQATDIGCDYTKAMAGCTVAATTAGCGDDPTLPTPVAPKCGCQTCVCAEHPECCKKPADGGGWSQVCVDSCRNECHGCENRPCIDRQEPYEDFFALMDAGFNVTAMGNSDSHNLLNEVGLPRTFVQSPTDLPSAIQRDDVNRTILKHHVMPSSGPFITLTMTDDAGDRAGVGEILDASKATKLQMHLKVQTASWFKVDRVEIYGNADPSGRSKLLKRLFIEGNTKENLVDLDTVIDLPKPAADAWYMVAAYGINDKDEMSPVYKRHPYGEILITTVISLGAQQIMASFGSLLDSLKPLLGSALDSITNSIQLPDSFPVFPYSVTNPIRVDVDGNGYSPPAARKAANGSILLPPFCSHDCTPAVGTDGLPVQADCGLNQVCRPTTGGNGRCAAPIPDTCVGLQKVGSR